MLEAFVVSPTVLVRLGEEGEAFGVVTLGKGEEEALVVFRGPEDARAYQEHTGKHTAAEGVAVIGMDLDAVSAVLDVTGVGRVAMPEPWTGDGLVDLFEARDFFALFREELEGSADRPTR